MVSASPGIALDVGAEPFVPERRTLPALREAVQGCRGCDLYRNATQAVFGEGAAACGGDASSASSRATRRISPASRSSVPPGSCSTGRSRRRASTARETYVTNAVKHFKWQARGKRRIHQKPNWSEVAACRPWLEAELDAVQPRVVVCLGATAAQSLLGQRFPGNAEPRQAARLDLAEHVTATIHPSAILRQQDDEAPATPSSRRSSTTSRVVARLLGATAARRSA